MIHLNQELKVPPRLGEYPNEKDLIRVRPGTWIVRKEDETRTDQQIREDFREKFKGCSFGTGMQGFHHIGIEEAANICKQYPEAASRIRNQFTLHYEKCKQLINRVEHIAHKYHLDCEEYTKVLRECLNVDVFDSLTNEMILRDIQLFNEKYLIS